MDEYAPPHSFDPVFRRAQLLLEQHRYADAADWFKRALQFDPEHATSMALLAMCLVQDEKTHDQAEDAARRGVSMAPESSFHHSVLALCILNAAKPGQDARCAEALRGAEKALELDTDSDFAWAVKGHALARLRRWADAESAARQSLALDTSNGLAAQVLSVALMNQGKDDDLQSLADMQLHDNADDDSAHVTAGFRQLRQGNHREACEHFRTALRIDPSNEMARLGLIESFRARSFIYRWYVRFNTFMSKFSEANGRWIMLAGFIGYKFTYNQLKTSHPALASVLIGVWLTFAFWTVLARGIGSALMLLDPFVRMAIRPRERWEGICVGGLTLLALIMLGLSFGTGSKSCSFIALVCIFAAMPSAYAFTNDHHIGKWLDLGLSIVSGFAALYCVLGFAINGPAGLPLNMVLGAAAIFIGVGISWLRMFGLLYR